MDMSYLSTPEFVTTTLHISSILAIPIYLLGFYCILFKTPNSMKSVKWCLLNLHFWSVFMDISITFLVCPVVIIPVIGGSTFGVLNYLRAPAIVQWYLITTALLAVGGSVVSIMENRYYMMFAKNSWWRNARYPFLVLNYVFVFTGFVPPLFHVPDQKQIFRIVTETYPQILITPSLTVITLDELIICLPAVITSSLFAVESTLFNFILFATMKNQTYRLKLSPRTYDMQKKFLIAIFIQISIPTIFLLIPAFYFEYSIFLSFYNQVFNNFGIILLSFHGWISTIVMLSIHEPYRSFCSEVVWKKIGIQKRRNTIVTTQF